MKGLDVAELAGSATGRTAFVLGNGPSVLEHDLHKLDGHLVIGMNASTLLSERFGFRTTHYVVSDLRFIKHPEKRQFGTNRLPDSMIRVFREELRWVDDPDWVPRTYYVKALGRSGFSENLQLGFYHGCTTTMLAIQLAFHMGAVRIALLGNDLKYSGDKPRFYEESQVQSNDPFLSVQLWNVRNAARELCERGCELFICTKNSNLVPYVRQRDFDDLVAADG